ncbi:MAG: RNA polymerase factor sigma-54 [Bacteroidetes bacterium]|nr:RNA polymerase factor sigma-54 [Bacteroidota bacterium]
MLNQRLQQKLLQKLSPQQILLIKLLQVPTIALEQRIKQEIEENPALEELDEDYEEPQTDNELDDDVEDSNDDEFDITDYVDEDDIPDYRLNTNNSSQDDEYREMPFVSGISFQENLIEQLGLRILDERTYLIALNIVGNLDDAGYLGRELNAMIDDLAFSQNIHTTKEELNAILKIVQDLDPAGIGARTLQECLILQLQRKVQTPIVVMATNILTRYFDEFTRKHYDKIIKKAHIKEDQLKASIEEILKLNPKPGGSLSDTGRGNHYIMPDFIVNTKEGILDLQLNSKNTPELRLSRTYTDMLETYAESRSKNTAQKEALSFIKQKIDSAKWFIDAIKQRQNTLYLTMNAIMKYQKEYFLTGDETKLRPMILKDIAEIVNLDISTISRVANSKYVQTPFGTFLLKSFFSESMQTDSGEEVSTREIKKILSDCISNEQKHKPLTDEQLTDILRDKGYNIARRTVAKYRELLNIPVARLRKEL